MIRMLILIICLFTFTTHAQEQSNDGAARSAPPGARTPMKRKVVRKRAVRTTKMRPRRVAPSFFWYGSLGYDLGGDVKFSEVQVESTIVPGFNTTSTYKTGSAIEFAGGFFSMRRNSWGYGGNLAYQMARKIKAVSIDGTDVGGGGSISTILFQGNGIYRMNNLFFPFGLNLSLPSNTKSDVGTTSVKGDIGGQLGVGYIPGISRLFFHGGITMIGVQAQTKTVTETYTYKTAYLMALGAKVGYLF